MQSFFQRFDALQRREGLADLDAEFLAFLGSERPELRSALEGYRATGVSALSQDESSFLLAIAPLLESFLGEVFELQVALAELNARLLGDQPIVVFKKQLVHKLAKPLVRKLSDDQRLQPVNVLPQWLIQALPEDAHQDLELAVASFGAQLLQTPDAPDLPRLVEWASLQLSSNSFDRVTRNWVSFRPVVKRDYARLVETVTQVDHGLATRYTPQDQRRHRDGFALTDQRMSTRQIQDEVHYCVVCHTSETDCCAKGFPMKKREPELGFKTNPVGEQLEGCPLDEKVSEMMLLRQQGYGLAALAMIMVDNPLCALTGHRICNECMKSCIYQKQDPVNVPEVETASLMDILDLPWGIELYALLMRWNPLRQSQYLPNAYNGRKILVMGMGPAGIAMAHHLMMEGYGVMGMDGLKIEPLPETLLTRPLRDYTCLAKRLDARVVDGFGGVAEYGITVRWDKNFLRLVYVLMMRRRRFGLMGNTRFGGSLTIEDAWSLGFDHLVMAVGAGLPRALQIPGSMAPGMRQANDFLMALQLTGAVKPESVAALEIALPAVVVGGGLTGVDAATELAAFYPVQVERVARRMAELKSAGKFDAFWSSLSPAHQERINMYQSHAQAIASERAHAQQQGRSPNLHGLVQQWGGVKIVYRKRMIDAPAYRSNHEELAKALEEGIGYVEGHQPQRVALDEYGQVAGLICQKMTQDTAGQWQASEALQRIEAKTILVATGAQPNLAYAYEHAGVLDKANQRYILYELDGKCLRRAQPASSVKLHQTGYMTSYANGGDHRVSVIGDTHPVYSGNVVKAIASAMRAYPSVAAAVPGRVGALETEFEQFVDQLVDAANARLIRIEHLANDAVCLMVRAPWAARNAQPGQFYRLQNFETAARQIQGRPMVMEAMSLAPIFVDVTSGSMEFLVVGLGVRERLLRQLEVGDPISLMGPTGARFRLPKAGERVLMITDRLRLPQALALARAMHDAEVLVDLCVRINSADHVLMRERCQQCSDRLLWLFDKPSELSNIADHETAKFSDDWRSMINDWARAEYVLGWVAGEAEMLKQIQASRHQSWSAWVKSDMKWVASVYGPMQCMLKGVCAQCLQWQIDPETGQRTKAVYACSWQNEPMDIVDMEHLAERDQLRGVVDALNAAWLEAVCEQEILK